ncbi:MAG: cytochrome P450 [Proteobacteria bacterium]|nr:MAG: cytochrome P450 [Pseudomonadota bacterium]
MSAVVSSAKSVADLKGPKGLPIVGNLFQIDITKFHQNLEQWCDEFGPIFKIRMGPTEIVCVADAGTINEILRDRPETYRRRRTFESVMGEMGFNGVFSSEGDNWKRQRKIVALALNSAHLHEFFPELRATTQRLQQRWERAADTGASIDLCRDLMRYTVDITTHLAFGVNANTIETDGPRIQQQLDKVFPMLGRRINTPFPYWRYLRLPMDRKLDRALLSIRETVNGFIADCRQRMSEQRELYDSPTNFLEAIIAAQAAEEGVEFTDDDIYANVLTLLLAGEDTTANTIAWAVSYFIDFPEHYERARAEVDALIAPESVASDHKHLTQLPFIEAFANETMRLKPIAPLNGLETNEGVELMGYYLPPGTPVLALTRQVATDPTNFGAAERFDPDRWLDPASPDSAPHNTQAFLPFGTGPRFCPGRNLALVEIKIVLAMLCRNFDIALADPSRAVEEKLSFTMQPTNLTVNFSRRN